MSLEWNLLELLRLAQQRLDVDQAFSAHRRWQELSERMTEGHDVDTALLGSLYIYTGKRLERAIEEAKTHRDRRELTLIEWRLLSILAAFERADLTQTRLTTVRDQLDALAVHLAAIRQKRPQRRSLEYLCDYVRAKSEEVAAAAAPERDRSADSPVRRNVAKPASGKAAGACRAGRADIAGVAGATG